MKIQEKDLIDLIEQKTGLHFQFENVGGNLCYQNNNSDLRDEYKVVFNAADLEWYIRSFGFDEVLLPIDSRDFWLKVRLAKERYG